MSYNQGNIAGLDEQHTRALVASTVETESYGGQLDTKNPVGYMGRYQAGASWLAAAGLIEGGDKSVIKAMNADGFTREWDWAVSGGMTRFLKNEGNWVKGMSYEKYLASADIQNAAFKKNSDILYNTLKNKKLIKENTSQAEIAGLLKAGHIGGLGGAMAVAKGGTGKADANGKTPRDYYNDLVQKGHVYLDRNIPTKQTIVGTGTRTVEIAKEYVNTPTSELMKSGKLSSMVNNQNHIHIACANFVSAVLIENNLLTPNQHTESVAILKATLQKEGWKAVSLKDAQPGDIVIMQEPSPNGKRFSHVEIVVKNENGNITLIGSNNNGSKTSQTITEHTKTWWHQHVTVVLSLRKP